MPNKKCHAIEHLLHCALSPSSLRVIDESEAHAGHAGVKEHGGGHFYVRIVSSTFNGLPLLARHRLVYAALADLMPQEIHACRIEAFTPEESTE